MHKWPGNKKQWGHQWHKPCAKACISGKTLCLLQVQDHCHPRSSMGLPWAFLKRSRLCSKAQVPSSQGPAWPSKRTAVESRGSPPNPCRQSPRFSEPPQPSVEEARSKQLSFYLRDKCLSIPSLKTASVPSRSERSALLIFFISLFC